MREAFLKQWSKVPFWAQFGICIIGGAIVITLWNEMTMTPGERAHRDCVDKLQDAANGQASLQQLGKICTRIQQQGG